MLFNSVHSFTDLTNLALMPTNLSAFALIIRLSFTMISSCEVQSNCQLSLVFVNFTMLVAKIVHCYNNCHTLADHNDIGECVDCCSVTLPHTGWLKKSKLLTQYNSLLFFEPPCILLQIII